MKLTTQRKHLWLSNKIDLLLTSRVSPFPTAHGQEQSSQDLVYPPFRSLVRHLPCARTAPWTGSLVVQAEAISNTRLKCSSIVQTPQKHGRWSPAVRETDAQSPDWMESSGTMLRISLLSSFWLVRIARGNEWHPWTPRLYFVDGFLEHLANADSESTQMRKADSTVSAAEGLPWSRTPLIPYSPVGSVPTLLCDGSQSSFIPIRLRLPLPLREMEDKLCLFPSYSQLFPPFSAALPCNV